MFEVELKLRASHETVRPAIEAAGATRLTSVSQVDTYYDAPHRDFAETDEALRIRQEEQQESSDADDSADSGASDETETEPTTKLTYKGPLVDANSKTREEHETGVDDADTTRSIFEDLGFEPAAVVEKHRTFFELDRYTVTLDRVESLGEFVEVEAEADSEDDIDAVREGAFDVLDRLGLDPDEQIRTSYLSMLLDQEV
ncbi:MAG: class IV adenylate cyclase [Halobellus sp.]|uniref:class IV adenylate cyclase n=1 Tax=Halobellus sp. TaxID=1979212 RepID=UPI0035D4BF5E